MASSSNKSKTVQLIRCFCGCSEMSVEEVRRIYTLTNSMHHTLLDPQAAKLFRRYLETQRVGDKGEAEQYLDVYEKCAEFLQEEQRTFTLDHIEELRDLGLADHHESDLMRRTRGGQDSDIKSGLNRIQGDCLKEIEASSDFKEFRSAILKKMQRIRN
ncbi:uncharacterized protein LOC6575344 [Drosophila mojavensis]|uniref:Uncharacterized protein n=1 Tax=Drosophila mojavensis TaxID=7230 RepID=B4KAT0_DROMO|nr:uncharacterized protein LOC6575344 [Drosophila mojavensis]EDW16817.1 uncharacterized protein Dmoj_GI22020 [Drosophila mojavensis]